MSTNNNNKTTIANTFSRQDQSPRNELVSSIQRPIEQQNETIDNNMNQQKKKKKKKSHGNRKEQHKRRRERRKQQNLNNDNRNAREIPTNSNREQADQEGMQNQPQNMEHQPRSKNNHKRKRRELNQDRTHIHQSISQLSISQLNRKKKKLTTTTETTARTTTTTTIATNDDQHRSEQMNRQEEEFEDGLAENSIKKFKPQYLQVSNRILKKILSNVMQDTNQVIQCLDTDEKLQAVRQMMELTNNLHYFNLQGDLWQSHYNLGIKENMWITTQTTNSPRNQSNRYQTYFFPKPLVEQRQKTIAHQKQRTNNELQEYLIHLQRNVEQWQPSIDFERLKHIVIECVKKAQQRLKQQFIYKGEIIELDLHDRQMISKFYDLQPNPEQIDLTKRYWQIVANEQRTTEEIEKLRQRIYLKRIPSKINKSIDRSIDHIQPMLQSSALDKDRRAGLISNCSKTITQYKVDLMSIYLNTLEEVRRGHQKTLIDLDEKISQSCPNTLKEAIYHRRQTMKKRHEKFLEHTLKTFFDEAPTMTINE